MVEEGRRPTVEMKAGAIDLIATSYRDMMAHVEELAIKYRDSNGEFSIPQNSLDAYELGNVLGLTTAYRLTLELAGQKERIEAIDREVAELAK